MSASVAISGSLRGSRPLTGAPVSVSPRSYRALLLAACLAAVLAAAWLGQAVDRSALEPDLARLLRGMALIKGTIVLAAVGVLWWRFGRPVPPRLATAYLLGAAATAGASMLIWQLAFIPAAAIVFHVGEFTLLIAAWRDHGGERLARSA